jgi:hypothetical protein
MKTLFFFFFKFMGKQICANRLFGGDLRALSMYVLGQLEGQPNKILRITGYYPRRIKIT